MRIQWGRFQKGLIRLKNNGKRNKSQNRHFQSSLTPLKKWCIALLFTVTASASAYSHQLSTAYLKGDLNAAGGFSGELQIRLFDLERSIGIDKNSDGKLLWSEVLVSKESIQTYLNKSLQIKRNQTHCQQSYYGQWKIDSHYNESYLVLPVRAQCSVTGELSIHYRGLYDLDSNHKLIATINVGADEYFRVMSNSQREINLQANNGSWLDTLIEFTWQGMLHIWIGVDHILFLLCFLLAVVYSRTSKTVSMGSDSIESKKNPEYIADSSCSIVANTIKTGPIEIAEIKQRLLTIVGIISAFTLAHSLTLVATALDWIQFSSRWIEVGIAATVLFSAINNIFSFVTRLAWLTFFFGLLHGMGFAGVLSELGLPHDQKLLSILAFNLGVEFGQVVIVLLMVPVLLAIKRIRIPPQSILSASSAAIAIIATVWIVERI